jgi:hypothetical protein
MKMGTNGALDRVGMIQLRGPCGAVTGTDEKRYAPRRVSLLRSEELAAENY